MRRTCELHLEDPFAGSRMLRGLLRQEGHDVGRLHVSTLMKKMAIEAIHRRPNTSKPAPGHRAVSSGRGNTSMEEVAMTTGRRRFGRAGLTSPGRPPVAQRADLVRFWAAIAAGLASEVAAVTSGVSQAVGTRWVREAGGMPPARFAPSAKPLCGRYLAFVEREEIALLRVQGCGVRELARRLGRAASTVSRELRRNAATRLAAAWTIEPPPPNGTPTDPPGAPSR